MPHGLDTGIHVSPPPLRLARLPERIRHGLLLLRLQLVMELSPLARPLRTSLERAQNSELAWP